MFLYIGFIGIIVFALSLYMMYRTKNDDAACKMWSGTGVIAGIIGFVLVIGWVLMASTAPNMLADNQAEYEELMIYKYTVEQSTNEYVRWNYYDKVCEWNDRYTAAQDKPKDSFWWGPYQFDLFEGTSLIEFELHGDNIPAG